MRSSHSLDRLETAFDDDRLVADAGLLLPATLAAHLGLRELVDRHLDLGARPGAANAGDKLLTLVMSALAGPAGRQHQPDPGHHRQGGVHPGHVPAQLPLGPCPPARPGQPGAAGPRLGSGCGTRRSTLHDRSRLHDLRDVRAREGGRATPRVHRRPGLPPPARGGGRHGRCPDGAPARRQRQHRAGRRPLPARDDHQSPRRGSHGPADDASGQRLLRPRGGRGLPRHGRPLLDHAPEAGPCP
jgi:hypothetical protein